MTDQTQYRCDLAGHSFCTSGGPFLEGRDGGECRYAADCKAAGERMQPKIGQDQIRIIRMVVYEGDRAAVEDQVKRSIHGTRKGIDNPDLGTCHITAVTLGEFGEILARGDVPYPGQTPPLLSVGMKDVETHVMSVPFDPSKERPTEFQVYCDCGHKF